jgi:hypothetical protein
VLKSEEINFNEKKARRTKGKGMKQILMDVFPKQRNGNKILANLYSCVQTYVAKKTAATFTQIANDSL